MSVQIDTTAENNALRLVNQGAHPAAPSVNHTLLYIMTGTNSGLFIENSVGEKIGPFITGTAVGGGRTLIAEVLPTGTSIIVSAAIPGTYKKITLEFAARSTQAATNVNLLVEFNGDTTDGNYRYARRFETFTNTGGDETANTRTPYSGAIPGASSPSNAFGVGNMEIVQYANTNFLKIARFWAAGQRDTSIFVIGYQGFYQWANTAAITQIAVNLSAGNFVVGSVFRLYGET